MRILPNKHPRHLFSFWSFSSGRLYDVGAYSRLDSYYIFTIFSRTVSVSLFSIKKTKKKEHSSKFIQSICNFFPFFIGGRGSFEAGYLFSVLTIRVCAGCL